MTKSRGNFNKASFITIWVVAYALGYWPGTILGIMAGEKIGFRLGNVVASSLPYMDKGL